MNLLKITSISKKITLASVGFFLIVFLLVHLGINLCLLRSDGGAWFIAASHFMGTNYIVKVFEIVLMATVLIHICLAISLQIQNWRSRPVRYKVATKSKTSFMSKQMIWTGGLVLVFLGIHFVNFYFTKLGLVEGKYMVETEHVYTQDLNAKYMAAMQGSLPQEEQATLQAQLGKIEAMTQSGVISEDKKLIKGLSKESITTALGEDFKEYEPDFYTMSIDLFAQKAYSIIYIILFIALGLHLNHAFKSAFQTFGLNHNKYNCAIKLTSLLYALVISIGFSIIPVYFMFFYK